MNIKTITLLILVIISLATACWGFTITEPKSGAVFYPGDKVIVKALSSAGENIEGVFFVATKMNKVATVSWLPYEFTFTIDSDFIGPETITAIAKMVDKTHAEAKVAINVVLPANLALKNIDVDPTLVFLYKLPFGSDPNDIRIFETKRLGVGGMYSDGIEREITGSSSGTTYASSDEKIVTVDREGKMTAQGLGNATITVKNGKYSATVKVVVKTYKK